MSDPRMPPLLIVLAGGALAATLDITFACTYWALKANVPAMRILQPVAAGVRGKASFEGAAGSAALGLALPFFIACVMALLYYGAAMHWPVLHQRPWLCGAAYGVALYLAMTFVVVPLSATTPGSRDPLWIALSVVAHVVLVGIPIAFAVRRALG